MLTTGKILEGCDYPSQIPTFMGDDFPIVGDSLDDVNCIHPPCFQAENGEVVLGGSVGVAYAHPLCYRFVLYSCNID